MAKRKLKIERIDGELHAKDVDRLRGAIREVWMWTSVARRVCLKRALIDGGFSKCEECKTVVAKVYADHIDVMGDIFARDYIKRMWCHSSKLQALCKKCHDRKTRAEKKAQAKPKTKDKWKNF